MLALNYDVPTMDAIPQERFTSARVYQKLELMKFTDTFFVGEFKFIRFLPLFEESGDKLFPAQTAFDALAQSFMT